MNILHHFITKSIKEYRAPSREGSSRGEVIGFSAEKHAAALWTLRNIPQKEVAIKAKCNYRSMLVWRTQDDFKDAVRDNIDNLARIVVGTAFETWRISLEEIAVETGFQYHDTCILQAMDFPKKKQLVKRYGDILLYAPWTVNAIGNAVIERFTKEREIIENTPYSPDALTIFIPMREIIAWIYPAVKKQRDVEKYFDLLNSIEGAIKKTIGVYLDQRFAPIIDAHDRTALDVFRCIMEYLGVVQYGKKAMEAEISED